MTKFNDELYVVCSNVVLVGMCFFWRAEMAGLLKV